MPSPQSFRAARIGRSVDELVALWGDGPAPRYAGRVPGLDVLAGETLALVGPGAHTLLDALAEALQDGCEQVLRIDGGVAARGGTLRIHAQQAARVGVAALAISDPLPGLDAAARSLAVADLAGLAGLGLTTVVAVSDVELAAHFADRVVVVRDGRPVVAYPVVAPVPRRDDDVAPVAERVRARLLASA